MRHAILGFLVAVWTVPAQAQDLPFDIVHTNACIDESLGFKEMERCIGASANVCMDSSIGSTTVGMSGCINHELKFWDGLLNEHYRDLRSREIERGQDWGEPVNRAVALRDMQRAWIPFRDMTCNYERVQWGGGTGGGPAMLGCMMRMTGLQAIYLQQILENF